MSTVLEIFLIAGVVLFLIGISYFATQDAQKRGFNGFQVYLIRVACVIGFPVSLILYFIFRPALRT